MYLRLLRPVPLLSLSTRSLPIACVVFLSLSVVPDKTFKNYSKEFLGKKVHIPHEHHFHDTVKGEHLNGQVII